MSETNQSRTASPTISQTRVGVDFNPSGAPAIDAIKRAGAAFIDAIREHVTPGSGDATGGSSPRVRGTLIDVRTHHPLPPLAMRVLWVGGRPAQAANEVLRPVVLRNQAAS